MDLCSLHRWKGLDTATYHASPGAAGLLARQGSEYRLIVPTVDIPLEWPWSFCAKAVV